MLYGNKDSGPLHIKITVQRKGTVMVAQPPGVWGKLPDGFKWCGTGVRLRGLSICC